MQNNVTELTQKLLRSLDNNYNVIDMPAVLEIISLLEKVAITKELLETTRLGKHVNELRRKTTNDSLSKRAKELVKKWRSMVLPESNGQIRTTPPPPQSDQHEDVNLNQLKKRRATKDVATALGSPESAAIAPPTAKRVKLNGMSELDFSDNSNSSFKDVINNSTINLVKIEPKRDVILINSDSNSSLLEGKTSGAPLQQQDPPLEQPQPKKRGRKKGSKNHKNLIDEAESAFSTKLAVSRGNSKVKTTQELIASLQNRNSLNLSPVNSSGKTKEDLNERAAKLTERVSIIDQKLNTNSNRFKNSKNKRLFDNSKFDVRSGVVGSGSVINDKGHFNSSYNNDEEVIIVDEPEEEQQVDDDEDDRDEEEEKKVEKQETEATDNALITSLSVEEALAQLPPIDKSILYVQEDDQPTCTCYLREIPPEENTSLAENNSEENKIILPPRYEMVEDPDCPAKKYLVEKYNLDSVTDEQVERLHICCLPNVNGNLSLGGPKPGPQMLENGLYMNVVPNVNIESIPKNIKSDFPSENFKKYSISEEGSSVDVEGETGLCENKSNISDDHMDVNRTNNSDHSIITNNVDSNNESSDKTNVNNSGDKTNNYSFREWHEVVETSSYNGEILRILPYVIID